MRLFIPFTKIDEEKREAHGRLTQEMIDRDGEILDYASSKPFFEKWSGYFADATGGKSVGNLRAMHRNISAGKLTEIVFDDAEKAIDIVAKVVDDAEWAKCVEGVYTGFSAAGKVIKQWKDGVNKRYTADPYEASLADFPCVPSATFSYVKLGGAVETRAFQKSTAAPAFADEQARRFSIATPSHIRASLALWSVPAVRAKYPDDAKATISRKIREAARREKIVVTEKGIERGDFAKGLYDVGQLASAIDNLRWLQTSARYERESEQDGSPVPDQLLDAIASLMDTLKEMVGEECDELLEILEFDAGEFATAKTAGSSISDAEFSKVAKKHMAKAAEIADHGRTVHKAMTDLHKAMGTACKTMGEHVEKLASFHGDLSGIIPDSGTKKVAGSQEETTMADQTTGATGAAAAATDTTEKTAGAAAPAAAAAPDFAKMSQQLSDIEARLATAEKRATDAETKATEFEKLAKDLAEAGEQLATAVSGRPGVLRAVGKSDDASGAGVGAVVEKTAGAKVDTPATPRDAFKTAFRSPQIQTGLPGVKADAAE